MDAVRRRQAATGLALLMVLGALLVPAAASAGAEERLLVVREDGSVDIVVAQDASTRGKLLRSPGVVSVESDGVVRAASASWDSASWDSASWDSASWDSASWDSASWDSASWDSATWDSASWDSASWDSASWDSASWDAASWDSASWDASSWDSVLEPGTGQGWGLFAIGVHASGPAPVHNRLVCVVDSGVDASHPALAANLWRGANGAVGWNAITGGDDVTDGAGHGTHLAGILAGDGAAGPGLQGVGRPLVASVKALADDGIGATSDVIRGIAWCSEQDADVILLALTEDEPTKAFREAVRDAQREGALVVASAGNAGPCERCVSSPGDFAGVLAVGAAGPDKRETAFSSSGPEVDLLAPGLRIAGAYPGGGARAASGTSQAAAFAAGAAAFLWGLHPDWSAERVAAHLERTAAEGEDGALLDLHAAVEAAR